MNLAKQEPNQFKQAQSEWRKFLQEERESASARKEKAKQDAIVEAQKMQLLPKY